MPRRGGRKNSAQAAYLVYGDTPEIEALSTGFARQGYYSSGYEKARVFANVTTSSYLAAKIKPDGTHAPARFAYATGIYEPDMGGIFAVGTLAKDLAAELNFKDTRALRTAFDKNMLDPDPSMPGTNRALVNGKPVFKFREVTASAALAKAAQAPAAKALAAVKAAQAPAAVHQTRTAAHRARMAERAEDLVAYRAASPVARTTVNHAFRVAPNDIREYNRAVNDLSSMLDGLDLAVDRATQADYPTQAYAGSVHVKEHDSPVMKSSRWY